jgi:hypothetical protein
VGIADARERRRIAEVMPLSKQVCK